MNVQTKKKAHQTAWASKVVRLAERLLKRFFYGFDPEIGPRFNSLFLLPSVYVCDSIVAVGAGPPKDFDFSISVLPLAFASLCSSTAIMQDLASDIGCENPIGM